MEVFSQWIKNMVTVSLLSGIAGALCGNMASAKRIISLITASAMLIVTVIPLKNNDIDEAFGYFETLVSEYEKLDTDTAANEITKSMTEEKLSEYTEKRLAECGAECEAEVETELTEDGYYAPKSVNIRGGDISEYEKQRIGAVLCDELGCSELCWDGVEYVYES